MTGEYRKITEDLLARMGSSGPGYLAGLVVTGGMVAVGAAAWGFQLVDGVGLTGMGHPIMWATYITDFVWWIGVAHAGLFISAMLYLFRARFRASFSRPAEAMTVLAMLTASILPILHLGRAWRFYWLVPYPNERRLWVTFRSPLILDVVAVTVYLIVAVVFFGLGLVPDLAVIRDRAAGWRKTIYGLLSLGWEGTGRQWKHYRAAYSVLVSLAAPLVISVHSIDSMDLSLAIVPGWHLTVFPTYFVIGALLSGLATLLMLVIAVRAGLRLQEYITNEHLAQMAAIVLMLSLLNSFCRLLSFAVPWLGSEAIAKIDIVHKATGAFAPYFWLVTAADSTAPLALFSPRLRRHPAALFGISLLINAGMWLEHFIVIAASLARDYLPYSWAEGGYAMALVEGGVLVGTVGCFLFGFLLFVRYLPVLSMAELRWEVLRRQREERALNPAPVQEIA